MSRNLHRRFRWLTLMGGAALAFVLLLGVTLWFTTEHFKTFGGTPSEAEWQRIRSSSLFRDNQFQNQEPTVMMQEGAWWSTLSEWVLGKELRSPPCRLPIVTNQAAALRTPPASGLRITWLGHSTTLIELDGAVFLTDPMWSERASPLTAIGPRRFHPPPLALEQLPQLDAVLISHEHYDHLDMRSVQALAARGTRFFVPLGIAAHLRAWGISAEQIREHEWWQSTALPQGVRVVSTPARHFNGRGIPWRFGGLWSSWSIVGPQHRVFFSGDTGYSSAFPEIAQREGPFDVALLEIGQYHPNWGEIHLGPAQALRAFEALRAKALLPVHWSTFELAYHAWSEPAETLFTAAQARDITLFTPRPGEPVEPANAGAPHAWWRPFPPYAPACPE